MAVLTVIPTTDVKLNDVRDTLNANGGSVNNEESSFFKEAANINKWSKWKPIPCNAIELTQALIANNKAGFYNLTIAGGGLRTLWGIFEHAVQVYDPSFEQFEWLYRVPTGGTSEPFRLGDFRNYDPSSTPIVRIHNYSVEKPWNVKQYFPQEHFYYPFYIAGIGNTIHTSDIKINGTALNNWKLGLMIIQDVFYNSSESRWDGTVSLIRAVDGFGIYILQDFAAVDSIEKGVVIFFMSPREIPEEIADPAGLMDVLDEQDYLLLHHACYPFTLFNGKDSVITLWSYIGLPLKSTLWYQVATSGTINNLTWTSGHGYFDLRHGAWLEDEVGVNEFAVKVTIQVANFTSTKEGNIMAYATAYNTDTYEVTEWVYIYYRWNNDLGKGQLFADYSPVDNTEIGSWEYDLGGEIDTIEITNFSQGSGETVFDGIHIVGYVNGVSRLAGYIPNSYGACYPIPLFRFGNMPPLDYSRATQALIGVTYEAITVEGVAVEPIV